MVQARSTELLLGIFFAVQVLCENAEADCANQFAGCPFSGEMPTFSFNDPPSPSPSPSSEDVGDASANEGIDVSSGSVYLAACGRQLKEYGINGLLPCEINSKGSTYKGWCKNGTCAVCVGDYAAFTAHADMVILDTCVFDVMLIKRFWLYAAYGSMPVFMMSVFRLIQLVVLSNAKWKNYYNMCQICKFLICLHSQGKAYSLCLAMSISVFVLSAGIKASMEETVATEYIGIDPAVSFAHGIALASWHLCIPCILYTLVDISMKKVGRNMLTKHKRMVGEDNSDEMNGDDIHKFGFVYSIISTVTNDALARKRRRASRRKRGDHLSLIDSHSRYSCLLNIDKRIFFVRIVWESAIAVACFMPYALSLGTTQAYFPGTFLFFKRLQAFLIGALWALFHQLLLVLLPSVRRKFSQGVLKPPGSLTRPEEGVFNYEKKLEAWREELKTNKERLNPVLVRWTMLQIFFAIIMAAIVGSHALVVVFDWVMALTPYMEPLRWCFSFIVFAVWLFLQPVMIKRTGRNYYHEEVVHVAPGEVKDYTSDDEVEVESVQQHRGNPQMASEMTNNPDIEVPGLTKDDIKRLRSVYNKIDEDGSDSIDCDEFSNYFGADLCKSFIDRCFQCLDEDGQQHPNGRTKGPAT